MYKNQFKIGDVVKIPSAFGLSSREENVIIVDIILKGELFTDKQKELLKFDKEDSLWKKSYHDFCLVYVADLKSFYLIRIEAMKEFNFSVLK
jgi:hypothetical protein